jgi:divalent metal cation (Fe/Co/Zn/Cd) transporter
MFKKILKLLKNIRKPVKYGQKYGKSFLGTFLSQFDAHLSKDTAKLIGQVLGSILLPFFYPFIKPLAKGFSENVKKKARYIFYAGLAIGGSAGSVLSNSFLKNIPSNLSTGISTLIGLAGVTFITLGIPFIVRKIRSKFWKEDIKVPDNLTNSVLSQPDFRYRFLLGLEAGSALGSTLGAIFGLFSPELGLIATGIGGMIGTTVGCLVAIAAPNSLKKQLLSSKPTKDSSSQYEATTKSIRVGLLLGTGLGAIIGSFLLPGVDSIVGTLLGGAFGLLAGAGSVAARKLSLGQGKAPFLQRFFGEYFFGKKNLANFAVNKKVSTATFSLIGGLVGTFFFPAIGTAGGAAIGALVGAIVAIGGGFVYSHLFPEKKNSAKNTNTPLLSKDNKPFDEISDKSTLKILKQEKLVFSVGSTVGAIAGSVIGSIIPGVGTILGGLIGSFIVGTICLLYFKYKEGHTTQKPITVQDQKTGSFGIAVVSHASTTPTFRGLYAKSGFLRDGASKQQNVGGKVGGEESQQFWKRHKKSGSDFELQEFKQPNLTPFSQANDKHSSEKENLAEISSTTNEKFSIRI